MGSERPSILATLQRRTKQSLAPYRHRVHGDNALFGIPRLLKGRQLQPYVLFTGRDGLEARRLEIDHTYSEAAIVLAQ